MPERAEGKRPRILVLEGTKRSADAALPTGGRDFELVRINDPHQLQLLQGNHFSGVFADTSDPAVQSWVSHLLRSGAVLDALPDGVAIVDPDFRVVWSNSAFEALCGCPAEGRGFFEALGSPPNPISDARTFRIDKPAEPATSRRLCRNNRIVELYVTRIPDSDAAVGQRLVLARDVTGEVNQQQKLTAIHQAAQELAALSPDQLAEMSVEDRIELLKQDIRRLTHDLLHYDVIEIRLLDRQTGRLEPLLAEGMTAQARQRVLYARAEGHGVTGYVAATGKSYVCPDTAADPRYLEGATGARSSVTVPLLDQNRVIGTLNVESPQLGGFNDDDLRFLEIFSRDIASALHTLDLLQAEKRSAASRSVEAISREVALPVDEILNAATTLLDRYIGHDADMAERLRKILASARSLKQCIQKVGEDLAPAGAPARPGETASPRLKGMRVLVADNDDRVRRTAHAILGRFGCVVETARDGQEALTMAKLGTYDTILADIRLPDVSGYEVFHRLHQAQPTACIILMTAYGYDPSHSIVKARQEGLRDVLYKPFRVDQLLDVLAKSEAPAVNGAEPRPAGIKT
jgi:CheY-like chemotaxis protein